MGLKITTEVENDKTVLTLRGKLTIGGGDVELRNAIHALLDQGVKKLVIDFKNVTRMDSSGIGKLAAAHMAVTKRGGSLELRGFDSSSFPIFPNFPNFPSFPDGFAF